MITITTIKEGGIDLTASVLDKLMYNRTKQLSIVHNKIIKGADVLECANNSDTSNEISNDDQSLVNIKYYVYMGVV